MLLVDLARRNDKLLTFDNRNRYKLCTEFQVFFRLQGYVLFDGFITRIQGSEGIGARSYAIDCIRAILIGNSLLHNRAAGLYVNLCTLERRIGITVRYHARHRSSMGRLHTQ